MKNNYPRCKDRRRNCHSFVNGACSCLTGTQKNCPFYKSKTQLQQERDLFAKKEKEYMERNFGKDE